MPLNKMLLFRQQPTLELAPSLRRLPTEDRIHPWPLALNSRVAISRSPFLAGRCRSSSLAWGLKATASERAVPQLLVSLSTLSILSMNLSARSIPAWQGHERVLIGMAHASDPVEEHGPILLKGAIFYVPLQVRANALVALLSHPISD